MKELWMRVGVTFKLTDEEAERIFCGGSDDMYDVIKTAMAEGRFAVEGETYVPECAVYNFNENYGTNYAHGDYECLM